MAARKSNSVRTARIAEFLGLQRSTVGVLAMVILVGMGERMAERFLPIYILVLGGGALAIGFLQAMDNLPDTAERPIVVEIESWKNVINVVIAGDVGADCLAELGEQVRDEVAGLPGVTRVELANTRPFEIAVEVCREAVESPTSESDL